MLIALPPPVPSEPCLTLGPAPGLLIGGTIRQLDNWPISGSSTDWLAGRAVRVVMTMPG